MLMLVSIESTSTVALPLEILPSCTLSCISLLSDIG